MKTKLFNVTNEEFYKFFVQDEYIDYKYLGDNTYQVFFYDKLGNLIACHIYKVEE